MICRYADLLEYINAEIWCAQIHTYMRNEKWINERRRNGKRNRYVKCDFVESDIWNVNDDM